MQQRFWEDIEDGETLPLGTATMSREKIVAFASEFDPQPFHLDDEAARGTLLGGLAASGWHTCAVVMDLVERAMNEHALPLQTPGAEEIRWRKPVRPGDALSGRVVLSSKSTCACGSSAGACRAFVEVFNQSADSVVSWRMDCIVPRREPATATRRPACPMRSERRARVHRVRGDHAIKFFDDVAAGDEIALGSYAFTADRVGSFRTRHTDVHSGRIGLTTGVSTRFAHDWHVVSAWMHCIVRYYRLQSERLRSTGRPVPLLGPAAGVKHLRWHAPVRAGEVISYVTWAERKLEIASHSDWGLLIAGAEGVNAKGEVVVSFYPQMLLQRSPSC